MPRHPAHADHLKPYQWTPGKSANPAGRPKGSRTKLNELCLAMLHKDFAEHGEAVIKRVREQAPTRYLAAVVSLLPRQAQKIESPFVDLTDEELDLLEQHLAASRAKLVQTIDQHTPEDEGAGAGRAPAPAEPDLFTPEPAE